MDFGWLGWVFFHQKLEFKYIIVNRLLNQLNNYNPFVSQIKWHIYASKF